MLLIQTCSSQGGPCGGLDGAGPVPLPGELEHPALPLSVVQSQIRTPRFLVSWFACFVVVYFFGDSADALALVLTELRTVMRNLTLQRFFQTVESVKLGSDSSAAFPAGSLPWFRN